MDEENGLDDLYFQEPKYQVDSQAASAIGADLKSRTVNMTSLNHGVTPAFIPENYTHFTDYLGENIHPLTDMQEERAMAQGAGERWKHAAYKFVPGVAAKTLQSVGSILGAVPAALLGDIELMTNNAIAELGHNMEKGMDEALPIYQRQYYQHGNFLEKLGTSEFWANDAMDGLEFFTSAFLVSKGVGIGVRAAMPDKLLKGLTKYNQVRKTEMAKNLLQNGKPLNVDGFIHNTEFGLTTALNTLGEAGIEAYHIREELLNEGMNFDEANKAAAMIAKGNILALMLSNAWQSRLFLGAGPTNQGAQLRKLYNAGAAEMGEEATTQMAKTIEKGVSKLSTNWSKEFAKLAPISVASEGGWEENVQEAMQLTIKNAAQNDPSFVNKSLFDYVPAVADQMVKNFTETQGQSAIFLGGLLGLFGSGGAAFNDSVNKNKDNQDLLEAFNAATAFSEMNLGSIYKITKDGKPELDSEGNPIIDYDNVNKLMAQIFSDKQLYDESAFKLMQDDKTGFEILSNLIMARDFYKHTKNEDSMSFYKSISDLKSEVKTDEEKTALETFLEKHQEKLYQLAQITRAQNPIDGIDANINNNLRKALFFEGAKQFIIEDLINTEKSKKAKTGTPLDTEINNKIDKRLEFLNTMMEDSKNMFSVLTDNKRIKELETKGAFENKVLNQYKKELADITNKFNSSEKPDEKKELQKQIDDYKRKIKYAAAMDEQKYGFMFTRNEEGTTSIVPKAPMSLDIAREEAFRIMDGRSIAESASLEIGEAIERRNEIQELLETSQDKQNSTYDRIAAINQLLTKLNQYDETTSVYGLVGEDLFQQIREIVRINEELASSLEAEAQKVMQAYSGVMEAGVMPLMYDPEALSVLEQLTGYTVTEEGLQLVNEQARDEFMNFTKEDFADKVEGFTPQQITGKAVGDYLLAIRKNLKDGSEMMAQQKEANTNIVENFLNNFNKNSSIRQLLSDLSKGGIYEFDNYFTNLIANADLVALKQQLEDFLDEKQLNSPEKAENILEKILGAIAYFQDRIGKEHYNQADAKRLLKEYQDLVKPFEKAVEILRENMKKKGRKLEQIKQNEANEKWNALGRNHQGKIIDKELDDWLKDNLDGYTELLERIEKDGWNPIYAEYVIQLLISSKKNRAYIKILNDKFKAAASNTLETLETIVEKHGGKDLVTVYRNTTSTSAPGYRQNPRLALYQLLKNSVIFDQVHTLEDSNNVGTFLISNDITDFDIEGVDKKLKPAIDSHQMTLAYHNALDMLTTPVNLVGRVTKEMSLLNGLSESQFAPTPGQVAAIRNFYTFLNSKNTKGPFGNAAILGGITGGGKSKVFSAWSLALKGIDEQEIFAMGHTINSTRNINNQIGGRNSKDNLHVENFLPRNHSEGIMSDEQARKLAERLPEGLKMFVLDEAMSLAGRSLFNIGLVIDQYNKLHNSNAKFLMMGDPTQLTASLYDGITDLFSRYNLFNIPSRLKEFRNAAKNVKVMPYLSINYRSNIYATAALQSKYVGRIDLPRSLDLLSSELYSRENTQVVGSQMAQSESDMLETIKFNMGNGRTKLLVVANIAEANRMVSLLEEQLKATMNVGSKTVSELTIMTALDAQGEERNEVYINITPESQVNSVVNEKLRPLIRSITRKNRASGKIERTTSFQDYNTLMYTMIGRTTDYVMILPFVQKDGSVNPKMDSGAKAEVAQFEIGNKENKEEYSKRLKEEKRILEDLYGVQSPPVTPTQTKETEKTDPEENKDTSVREEDTIPLDEKTVTKSETNNKSVRQKQQVVVSKDDIKQNKKKTFNEEDQKDFENEDKPEDPNRNDDALVDNEDNDETSSTKLPPQNPITPPQGSYEMTVAHPKSSNLRPLRIGQSDQTRSYAEPGTEVYFAKVKSDNKYGFSIRVYAIADFDKNNKLPEDYNYVELGEISGEQYVSEYGQYIDSQISEQANPLPVQGGRFLRIKRGTLVPATVTSANSIAFNYDKNARNENSKKAIHDTIDEVINSLFAKEPGFNKDKVTVEFTIIKERNPVKINEIFSRLNLRPQSGAAYMIIGHDDVKFPVRLSNLPLTKNHLDVQIIEAFIRSADGIIEAFSPYIKDLDIGSRDFLNIINAVKEGFVVDPNTLKFSWVSDANVNWKAVTEMGIPTDVFSKKLKAIRNLIYKTYDVEQRLFTIDAKDFDAWKNKQADPSNFTLGEPVGKGTRFHVLSQKDENDTPGYVVTYNLTNKNSPLMLALRDIVKTNQFASEEADARSEIKNVRYETDLRSHNHKIHGASRMQAKNPFYSGEYNQKYFDFITHKIHRLQNKYGDLTDLDLLDVNLDTYESYLEMLREYQQKHPSREDVANTVNNLEKQKGNRENHKQMKLQDLKDLLRFNEDGISDFGDGQYLRAPIKTSYDLSLDNIHNFATSKLQSVQGTQLKVSSKPATQKRDDSTPPPSQPTPPLATPKKKNRFGSGGPKSRNYVGENTGEVISVEQAKEIAKRIIPGINDSQLEFIELALLQNRKNYSESETLLGQMRGKAIALGLVPGTEVEEGVYEKVLYHELMHLLWNNYIKPSERRAIINQLNISYPETKDMNHIELDEFIAEKFQDYNKKDQSVSFLRKLFDKIINWLNLLINEKKSLDLLFQEIHEGKYNANVDYSVKQYRSAVERTARKIEDKLVELERQNVIKKKCHTGGRRGSSGGTITAKDGLSNGLTKGGSWKVLKRFKGASHEQGGIDILINQNGIKMGGKQGVIKAEYGLVISKSNLKK